MKPLNKHHFSIPDEIIHKFPSIDAETQTIKNNDKYKLYS